MIFYFIRHAEPVYNPDILTEMGELQADALPDRLMTHKIEKVFSSSSNRAVLTAEPFCKKMGLTPVLLDWATEDLAIKEFFAYDKDGKIQFLYNNSEALKRFNTYKIMKLGNKWYEDEYFSSISDYSSGINRINSNTDEFFKNLGFIHNRKKRIYKNIGQKFERVAFFAHGGFGMIFLSSLLDIPYPLMCLHFQHSGHTGVTAIRFDETKDEVVPRIVQYSNDSHLFKNNLKPYHYLDV